MDVMGFAVSCVTMNPFQFKLFYVDTVFTLIGLRCETILNATKQNWSNISIENVAKSTNLNDRMLEEMLQAYVSTVLANGVLDTGSGKETSASGQAAIVLSNPSIVVHGNLVQNIYIGTPPSQVIKCEGVNKCGKEKTAKTNELREKAQSGERSSSQAAISASDLTTEWPSMVTIDQTLATMSTQANLIHTTHLVHHHHHPDDPITTTPSTLLPTVQYTPSSENSNMESTHNALSTLSPSTSVDQLLSLSPSRNGTVPPPTTAAVLLRDQDLSNDSITESSSRSILVNFNNGSSENYITTKRVSDSISKSIVNTMSTIKSVPTAVSTVTTTKATFTPSKKLSKVSSSEMVLPQKVYSSPMVNWSRLERSRTTTIPVHTTTRPTRLRPNLSARFPFSTSTDRQFSFLIRSPYDYFLLKKQGFEKKKRFFEEKIASLIFSSSKFGYKS